MASSSLVTMSSARADFSGSVRAQRSSSTDADRLLHLADPALQVLHPLPGYLAGGVPTVGDVAERGLRGVEVGDRHQRLGLDEQLLLDLGVGGELGVLRGVRGVAVGEEGVLRGPEPLPELLVDVARCRAGGLPAPHQLAVLARRRTPLGRVGQRLGLLGQPLLDRTRALALLVLLGEVRLAGLRVRRPGGREPPPQRVVGRDGRCGGGPSTGPAGRAAGWRRCASRCRWRASRPRRRSAPSRPSPRPASAHARPCAPRAAGRSPRRRSRA